MSDRDMTDMIKADVSCVGRIVYSVAGRDKKRPFVIIGIAEDALEDGIVYIADGKLHRFSSPKRKKLKHLSVTEDTVPDIRELSEDAHLYKRLKEYENHKKQLKDD